MKIGILTFHRAHNYGAVLQCYALQETLKAMGHEVEVIDYRQKKVDSFYIPHISFVYLAKALCRFDFKGIRRHIRKYKKNKTDGIYFETFQSKYLQISAEPCGYNVPQGFDAYIVGSDQVWGYHCTGGYDPVYWGDFSRNEKSRLIGYAISSKPDTLKTIPSNELCAITERFDSLSFREKVLADIVLEKTGKDFEVVLDPTLLATSSIWKPMLNSKWSSRQFILVYSIRGKSEEVMKKAKKLAKIYNYEVIDASNNEYSVEDFVSLFYYAKCVLNSSFHATAFSLIFGTPFYSFKLNDGLDSRYVNIIDKLDLKDHIAELDDEITSIKQIDKESLRNKVAMLSMNSRNFLESALL